MHDTQSTDPSGAAATTPRLASSADPDLVLVHPALEPRVVQRLLPEWWPDGDLVGVPSGYQEVSHVFPGLRAFLRGELVARLPAADPDLPVRVRHWVDQQAQRWDLSGVFATGDLSFWPFLRDGMIPWLCGLVSLRAQLLALGQEGGLSVLAAGVDHDQRRLLKLVADSQAYGRFRPEVAYTATPTGPAAETATERRARKIFFLLQDGWHGVRFVAEELLVRRPKVLIISADSCWLRRRGPEGSRARTDVHIEAIWREGRRLPLRLYYRSGSYHPDVGAMTGSRLPPVYWRHLLFLLAQKSRGVLETRSIQRAWRRLRESHELREAFVFEELDLTDLVVRWLDRALEHDLLDYARATRRESHFLRGVRPDAILVTHERDENRSVLAAALRLGIPTAVLQLRQGQWGREVFRDQPAGLPAPALLPDRICVFSPGCKAQLVEWGALDPIKVTATGDPRLDAVAFGAPADPESRERLRRRWGIEEGQRILGIACRPEEHALVLSQVGEALQQRQDAFLLLQVRTGAPGEERAFRQSAAGHGLRWIHLLQPGQFAEAMEILDALLATTSDDVAEGVLRRLPVVHLRTWAAASALHPDPGDLIHRADSAAALRPLVEKALAGSLTPARAGDAWRDYVQSVFGPPEGGAARRVLDVILELLQRE